MGEAAGRAVCAFNAAARWLALRVEQFEADVRQGLRAAFNELWWRI